MPTITSSVERGAAPRLLDQVRARIRFKHYSIRTEQAYVEWIKRFIRHFGTQHPKDLGAIEIQAYLTHLAVAGRVAASTQNQAKSALLFLYKEVLAIELPWLDKVESAKKSKRLPVVLTRDEVIAVLSRLEGRYGLIAHFTEPVCASRKACVCGSRTSISRATRFWFAMARAPKTG